MNQLSHHFFRKSLLFILIISCFLFGCGTNTKETEVSTEEITSDDQDTNSSFSFKNKYTSKNLPPELADITQEQIKSCKSYEKMTKNEFLDLSEENFKIFVAANAPDFRNIYKIAEETEMNSEEWTNLKQIMSYQLYGSIYPDLEESTTITEDPTYVKESQAIDETPISMTQLNLPTDAETVLDMTADEIKALNRDDLIFFINEYLRAMGATDKLTGEEVDACNWDKEELEQFRNILISYCLPGMTLRETEDLEQKNDASNVEGPLSTTEETESSSK